jgi:hypothetical protein
MPCLVGVFATSADPPANRVASGAAGISTKIVGRRSLLGPAGSLATARPCVQPMSVAGTAGVSVPALTRQWVFN